MKALFIFLFLSFVPFSLASQKSDYIWVLGHNGGSILDFNTSPPINTFVNKDAEMSLTNASIADANGNLLFYTNGCEVYNSEHQIMENGSYINPGFIHDMNCKDPFSAYTVARGAMILPLPGDTNKYYLFHQRAAMTLTPVLNFFVDKQYYSIIDISYNNGLGKVIEKNTVTILDTLHAGDLTAAKHINGLDWWIIVPRERSNKYYKILLTSVGITQIDEQLIGDSTFESSNAGGQAVFSPNGQLYVRYNPVNDIFLFDFDRSTGNLSNFRHIPVAGDSAFVGGAAISPNSRFLYIPSETKFYQFDLEAPDIAASQVLLGVYDGFMSPFATTFRHAQLAPDCKIYIACSNSANIFHVINRPDEPGLACELVQHGVQLATSNAFSIPNFPNYRLGVGPEPPCVLTAEKEEKKVEERKFRVFPNPASEMVIIGGGPPLLAAGEWILYDQLGRAVRREFLPAGQQEREVSLAGIAPGLYFWQASMEGRRLGSGKLLVTP